MCLFLTEIPILFFQLTNTANKKKKNHVFIVNTRQIEKSDLDELS